MKDLILRGLDHRGQGCVGGSEGRADANCRNFNLTSTIPRGQRSFDITRTPSSISGAAGGQFALICESLCVGIAFGMRPSPARAPAIPPCRPAGHNARAEMIRELQLPAPIVNMRSLSSAAGETSSGRAQRSTHSAAVSALPARGAVMRAETALRQTARVYHRHWGIGLVGYSCCEASYDAACSRLSLAAPDCVPDGAPAIGPVITRRGLPSV